MPEKDSKSSKRLVKAGELARRTGLTRQSLHMYVNMGLLNPASSTKGGQRLFYESDIERVSLIRNLCVENGYTLKEIRETFLHDK